MFDEFFKWVRRIFFVYKCADCGSETEDGIFCPACRNKRSRGEMRTDLEFIDKAIIGYRYEDGVKNVLHDLKFHHAKENLEHLREEVAYVYELCGDLQIDYVVPVPGDKSRKTERGYDIPVVIFANCECVRALFKPELLRRTKATLPQYGLSPKERTENVKNCFEAENVEGKNILLVDDILTTGSTLCEAARELKAHGAVKVYALTLCGSVGNFDVEEI